MLAVESISVNRQSSPNDDTTTTNHESLLTYGTTTGADEKDSYFERLQNEANQVLRDEPELERLLRRTVLAPSVRTFEDAVLQTLCHRLLLPTPGCHQSSQNNSDNDENSSSMSPHDLHKLVHLCMQSDILEKGWTFSEAIRKDAIAVVERDPAMETLLEVVLFAKGYMALCCHRVAYRLWHMKRKFGAFFMQSQTSAVFGVDIHPLAKIGKGVMMDHATGVVVGETATIGDGCTILHGVTLGGTGKESGDRHPKVGDHVLIGAGSLLLGNITVGNSAKIGAGSVLLRDIPAFATAVGVPAKIIGRTDEKDPADDIDNALRHVSILGRKPSTITTVDSTVSISSFEEEASSNGTPTQDAVPRWPIGDKVEKIPISHQKGHSRDIHEIQLPPKMTEGDKFCPFREYKEVAYRGTPKGTINILDFASAFQPEGIPQCVLGLCFYEMDHHGRGYITMHTFREEGPECISRNCGFSLEKSNELVQKAASLVHEKSLI